jgi:hypothetical protein
LGPGGLREPTTPSPSSAPSSRTTRRPVRWRWRLEWPATLAQRRCALTHRKRCSESSRSCPESVQWTDRGLWADQAGGQCVANQASAARRRCVGATASRSRPSWLVAAWYATHAAIRLARRRLMNRVIGSAPSRGMHRAPVACALQPGRNRHTARTLPVHLRTPWPATARPDQLGGSGPAEQGAVERSRPGSSETWLS